MTEHNKKPCFFCEICVSCITYFLAYYNLKVKNERPLTILNMLSSFSGKPTGMVNQLHCLRDTLKLLESGKPNECKWHVYFSALKRHCSISQKNMHTSKVAQTFSSLLLLHAYAKTGQTLKIDLVKLVISKVYRSVRSSAQSEFSKNAAWKCCHNAGTSNFDAIP